METQSHNQLNVVFVPYPTPGHMNAKIDTARLFAKYGVSVTIITTHANALLYQNAINSSLNCGYSIKTQLVPFPGAQVGLPDGIENIKDGTSPEIMRKIGMGLFMLRNQIELLIPDLKPDCLVTDMMYPWTVESAAKLGIPNLYFYNSSYFSSCTAHLLRKHMPHEKLVSGAEKFTVPGLPQTIEMTTLQLPEWVRARGAFFDTFNEMFESECKSYGALYNSFHELESEFEQLHKSIVGVKSWSVGPVSAWVNKDGDKKSSGENKDGLAQESGWLNWLNSKQNESVLYVTFGSLTRLPHAQIVEIAHGLEKSGHNFIWVIRKKDGDEHEDNFLQEFEQRMKESNKGFIIWNWAPQLLILNHPAIGGIVTHCGWNSILESINVGLSMITWPMFAEQFYNEKLLVDVLKIGVSVGAKENKVWMDWDDKEIITREEIAKVVTIFMGSGEEIKEMRRRARILGDAAKRTIEEGGSSYNNLMQLLEELKSLKLSRALAKSN